MGGARIPNQWDAEADVVVVGSGGAGMAACIEAARAGAQVICLERRNVGGGASALCGGEVYMGGGTPIQKVNGWDDTPDNMYAYLSAAVGDWQDPEKLEKIRLYTDGSLEFYDWLTGIGVPFKPTEVKGKWSVPPTDDCLVITGSEFAHPYNTIAKPVPRGHKVQGWFLTGPVLWPFLSFGGLKTDPGGHVMGVFGQPIPGLYAAGRNAAGIHGDHYSSGSSVGDAMFSGRIAGRNAAAEPVRITGREPVPG
ncbi:MAG: FAD-binding protein [Chloroflexi bacterium]|nr:FAD-binding protein [Chloroflexota bacterium]